ncbi:MAG: divergent polysaccharide deacetylase family protein [Acidobacteriota bacterium]
MARRGADEGRGKLSGRLLGLTAILVVAGIGGLVAWLDWASRSTPRPPDGSVLSVPLPTVAAKPPPAVPESPPAPPAAPPPEPPPAIPSEKPPTAAPAAERPPAEKPPTPPQQASAPPAVPAPPRPPATRPESLPPAPDPALVEQGAQGPLPIIGPDGRKPWQVYARPFDRADRRPRVAVILTGLGQSSAATEAAINDLPGGITLAFNPYAPRLEEWIERARAAGHEVLLSLAMEPLEYPRIDPGPHTLLVALEATQNLERTQWVLSRVTGYVGTITAAGSRFTTSKSDLLPVLDELKARGLMFVDRRVTERSVAATLAKSVGLPRAACDVTLDQQASRDAIDQHLEQLETLARQNGVAVGVGDSYPVTIERIARWAGGLERKGIALAPVSATADLQPERSEAQR